MLTGRAHIPHMSVSHRDPNTTITQEKLSDFHLILFFSRHSHNSPSYLHPLSDQLSAGTTCSPAHVGEAREAAMSAEPCICGGSRAAAAPGPGRERLRPYLSPPAPPPPCPPVIRCRRPQRKLRQCLQRGDSLRSLLEFAAKQQ